MQNEIYHQGALAVMRSSGTASRIQQLQSTTFQQFQQHSLHTGLRKKKSDCSTTTAVELNINMTHACLTVLKLSFICFPLFM
jgi:hypothetical protein